MKKLRPVPYPRETPHKNFCPNCGRLRTYNQWLHSSCLRLTCTRPTITPPIPLRKPTTDD